jgi:hypothetical protein
MIFYKNLKGIKSGVYLQTPNHPFKTRSFSVIFSQSNKIPLNRGFLVKIP